MAEMSKYVQSMLIYYGYGYASDYQVCMRLAVMFLTKYGRVDIRETGKGISKLYRKDHHIVFM